MRNGTDLESTGSDQLLRPEPRPNDGQAGRNGCALFGLMLAGIALFAIYVSSPVDMPEFPDCPIQSIGLCGQH
jgi:hypothetical protein